MTEISIDTYLALQDPSHIKNYRYLQGGDMFRLDESVQIGDSGIIMEISKRDNRTVATVRSVKLIA